MDSELAVRLGKFPGIVLFSGGAKDVSGKDDLTPEEMAKEPDKYSAAWNMLLESVLKGVAAMMIAVEKPREILLSGRLSGIPEIAEALTARLSQFRKVRRVGRRAKKAKEAAEGAYILGEGISDGKYKGITDALQLSTASGTMFDHVLIHTLLDQLRKQLFFKPLSDSFLHLTDLLIDKHTRAEFIIDGI